MAAATRERLDTDVRTRVESLQATMRDLSLSAVVIVGAGSPGAVGALRYLTNARLWEGPAYVVLGRDDPWPWLLTGSSYQASWSRADTTTRPDRVLVPDDLVGETAARARRYAGPTGRIGLVKRDELMTVGHHERFLRATEGNTLIDVTKSFDAIRQIKSPWELDAMREGGELLADALASVRADVRVGASYRAVCIRAEAYVRTRGSFWGRSKVSVGPWPYTVPAEPADRMNPDDVITIELVFESRWGYWHEMTMVGTFGGSPRDVTHLIATYRKAFETSASSARPGATFRDLSAVNDAVIAGAGFEIDGKHTPDAHSTGLDGSDGPSSIDVPDFVLRPDMVLSFHPGTKLADGRALLVSDNVRVTPHGAERLSPGGTDRYGVTFDE